MDVSDKRLPAVDFVNEADDIQKAFAPYYEKTILSEGTDPALLYDLQRALLDVPIFTDDRFCERGEEEQSEFRGELTDASLEKLYVYGRLLRRYLPVRREELPKEIQQRVDLHSGRITLQRGQGEVQPIGAKDHHAPPPEEVEPLSRIIRELNERFGTDFSAEERVFIEQLEEKLAGDQALSTSVRVNAREFAKFFLDWLFDRFRSKVTDPTAGR